VAQPGEHATNLAVLALVEHHLEHRTLFVLRADRDPLGMHLALREPDSAAELVEQFLRRHAGDLHEVSLLHAIAGMGQQIREITVIGEQEQALAREVEPADREQPLVGGHEIDGPGPARGVEVRRHDADGLVEQVHHPPHPREPLAVNADLLP
jgi:hypothetical protein